jgi:hypothetical protein
MTERKSPQGILRVESPIPGTGVMATIPQSLAEAMDYVREHHADLLDIADEKTLWKSLRNLGYAAGQTDNMIRFQFWREYERAIAEQTPFNIANVCRGICGEELFYKIYSKPLPLVWMLAQPKAYTARMEETLYFGLNQLRDVLELPNVDEKGKLNTKLLELKAKIVHMVDQRMRGGIIQRLEQKSMNLQVHTSDKSVADAMVENSTEALQKRLASLEERERRALNLPDPKKQAPIDVDSESV